ncbi:proton pump-interactor 1-like [Gastrolobium bilobum]|uniref:proton pump-interactor 1-like n=1 Tax=Gastrolobium bilobum TaxID=150636 RepID=UPI002AB1FF23|nr:proton pump-interactor 1-like [Gastrolobium bilobum]
MVQGPVEKGAEGDKSVSSEIGKLEQAQGDGEAIKFGSHGDETAKAEGNGVSDSNVPKNAVEEWTAPEQTHSFYFVRFRPYDDSNIKSEIDKLDKEINQKNTERFQLADALKAKRVSREFFLHGCLIQLFSMELKMERESKERITYAFCHISLQKKGSIPGGCFFFFGRFKPPPIEALTQSVDRRL